MLTSGLPSQWQVLQYETAAFSVTFSSRSPPHTTQADGSVVIPEALRPYMGGASEIRNK